MKRMRLARVLALVLTLAAALGALAGCGKKTGSESKQQSAGEPIVGKWEGEIDFAVMLEQYAQTLDKKDPEAVFIRDTFSGAGVSGVSVKLIAQFAEDGTYSVQPDQVSAGTVMVSAARSIVRNGLADGAGVKPEEITDEQVDSMLPYLGVKSWDELGQSMLAKMDAEKMFKSYSSAGKYTVRDGTFYYAADGEVTESSSHAPYEISGDTLRFLPGTEEGLPAFMKDITFKRAG